MSLKNLEFEKPVLNRELLLEFANLRLETDLNHVSQDRMAEWIGNTFVDSDKEGNEWIDDGSHGYLVVVPGHPRYQKAREIFCAYDYQLSDGTILLEEDCQAGKFLTAN